MKRTTIFWSCIFAGSLIFGPFAAAQREAAPAQPRSRNTQPDVFLITIDTLRADHVHCYGYKAGQTPAIDQLAANGVRFSQAFTPSPITNASHTTILTGLVPSGHGVTNFGVALDGSHPTMAGLLKEQGYQTAAFIGAVVLDSQTLAPGLDRGFDFYDNFPAREKFRRREKYRTGEKSAPAAKEPSRWGRVERRGKDVVARAEKWMDAHPRGPRFVWVHLYDPHDPYDPPPPYDKLFHDHLYDGEIAYADSALGEFLAFLRKHGRYEGAVVIVVGDHGEGLGEHHEETHGIFLYDTTTHVPLIVKLPKGQSAGLVVNTQVNTTDLLPSVLSILNLPAPAVTDGRSLKAEMEGVDSAAAVPGAATDAALFAETDYPLSFGWAPLRAVRDEGFKFIEAPRPEFYDLSADPGELHSIYEPWNPELRKLREKLAQEREKYPARAAAGKSAGTVGTGTTQELQALGYLGAADVGGSSSVAEPSLLPDAKDKIEEQNLLHAAMLAADDRRTEEARAKLEEVLKLNGDSQAALTQLGQVEMDAGDYGKAARYFGRAVAVRAGDANLELSLGEALGGAGDLRGAEKALQASLQLSAGQYQARFLLGSVYFRLGDFSAAQDQLEAALLIEARLDARMKLAEVYLAQEKFEEAGQQLEEVVQVQRDSAEPYELLARAYRGSGKDEKAQQAESRAKFLAASARNKR